MSRASATLLVALAFALPAFAQVQPPGPTLEEQQAANDERMRAEAANAAPVAVGLGVVVAGIVGTFLFSLIPPAIAILRGHNNWLPIGLVSVFLGWSCVGWIAALIWSFSSDTKSMDVRRFGRRYD